MSDDYQDDEPGTEVAVPGGDAARPRLSVVRDEDEERALSEDLPQPPRGLAVIEAPVAQPGERKAIIPPQFTRENIRGTILVWLALTWHRFRYHGIRVIFAYLPALAFWSLAGLLRGLVLLVNWARVAEGVPLEQLAADNEDSREWMRVRKANDERRKARLLLIAIAGGAAAIGGYVFYRVGRAWEWCTAGAVVLLILSRAGRPEGHRIVSPAVVPPQYEIPTPEVITRALGSLGIGKIDKAISDGKGLQFVSDVMRDGPGWGTHLDLPYGVTPRMIIARREQLASGLRRPLSATWPEGVSGEHEGRLFLWVGFHDISKMTPPKWPLAKAGTADIFAGIPLGYDPRQRPVNAPLFEVNWLIGASPGQGKTAAVRVIGCAAALDVICDLWIHEHAGKGDLEPLAQVCQRYVCGLDDESVAYSAYSAQALRAQLEKRSKVFGALKRDDKPEGKITRELAAAGFRPIVAIFDEAQVMFMHPEHGQQIADDLAHVMRLGRAYGIIVVIATQRPSKECLPTEISGVVTARLCMKVPDYQGNDLVLGTGAYKSGYRANEFRTKTDAGLGWLKGEDDPQIIKTYYLDLPAAARIAARARQMRERAGVLGGYALGLDDEMPAPRDVLADVLEVMGTAPAMHWDVLAERLAARWPERWTDITHLSLSSQCRALGVRSVGVSVDGQKDKGCRRAAVEEVVNRRA